MTLTREALAARLDRAEEKARKLKEDRLAREIARADRKDNATSHLAYRMKYLPQQLEDARRKLAALENEARRYRMFDLLETGQ